MQPNAPKWISSYLYNNLNFEFVIHKLIRPIIKQLQEKQKIKAFFFIRYWEKGPHIRLRVLPKEDSLKNEIEAFVKEKAESFFKQQSESSSKYSIEFHNYNKEIDRYGGIENINIAEQQFEDSSKTTLTLINKHFKIWDYSLAISFAIQMHLLFIKNTLGTLDDAILFFDTIYKNWLPYAVKLDPNGKATKSEIEKLNTFFKNSYEKQKPIINSIVKSIWFEENIADSVLKEWNIKCFTISEKLKSTQNIQMPSWFSPNQKSHLSEQQQILFSIYDSYIHMTNNRLGVHLRDEAFIAFLIVRGLKNIIEKESSITI